MSGSGSSLAQRPTEKYTQSGSEKDEQTPSILARLPVSERTRNVLEWFLVAFGIHVLITAVGLIGDGFSAATGGRAEELFGFAENPFVTGAIGSVRLYASSPLITPSGVAIGTLCVFAAMLMLYKTGLVKVTAKFRSVVSMMLVGYLLFALVNLVFALVTNTPFGIGGTGIIGIGISVFAIGLAAVTLMLDFDDIETAIATGAPVKYSWLLGMGLLVTLVWLYLEILRLLGRLRSSD